MLALYLFPKLQNSLYFSVLVQEDNLFVLKAIRTCTIYFVCMSVTGGERMGPQGWGWGGERQAGIS